MKRRSFWKSMRILGEYKRPLAIALAGALLSAVCFGAGLSMLLPVFHLLLERGQSLAEVIDEYLLAEGRPGFIQAIGNWLLTVVPADRFWGFVAAMGAVAFFSVIGSIGRITHQLLMLTVTHHVEMRWRRRLFRRLIHAPLIDVMREGVSDRIGRLVVDIGVMVAGYKVVLGRSTHAVLHGLAALVLALIVNWKLSLLVLVGAPVLGVMLRKFGKIIRKATRRALSQRGRMIGALDESLTGIRVVKVHDAEGYERRRFATINRVLYGHEMRARRVRALSSPLVELLALIGVILVASVAAWLIFRRGEEPEAFMTVLAALVAAAVSLRPLSNLSNVVHESDAAAERVLELLDLRTEPSGADTPPDAVLLPRHHESIAFDHVTFRYSEEAEPALRDVSFDATFGQRVAVVGPNGSGKSTLLSLLPRLIEPTEGRVLIDGVDLATVSLRSLRRQMAVVTQQTVLFEGTIAQNIAYGRRHIASERITAAAKAAHAHGFITALPKGYDTPLGEDGAGLSGGQMQRLAIARAVLRDPAVLILDEATSQIDAESEAEITRALNEISVGRTTFVIAHRLSTVVDADVIVVMDGGRIIDHGKHEELLKRCEVYRTLTQTQLRPPQ